MLREALCVCVQYTFWFLRTFFVLCAVSHISQAKTTNKVTSSLATSKYRCKKYNSNNKKCSKCLVKKFYHFTFFFNGGSNSAARLFSKQGSRGWLLVVMPKKLAAMLNLAKRDWLLMPRLNPALEVGAAGACQQETPLLQGPEQGTQVLG